MRSVRLVLPTVAYYNTLVRNVQYNIYVCVFIIENIIRSRVCTRPATSSVRARMKTPYIYISEIIILNTRGGVVFINIKRVVRRKSVCGIIDISRECAGSLQRDRRVRTATYRKHRGNPKTAFFPDVLGIIVNR